MVTIVNDTEKNFRDKSLKWTLPGVSTISITLWQVTAQCIDYTSTSLIGHGDSGPFEADLELLRPQWIDSLKSLTFDQIDMGHKKW